MLPDGTRADRVRVLVTDGDYKHTLGIVRQLGSKADVYVASTRRMSLGGVSRLAHANLRCPSIYDSPAFTDWLDRAIARYRIDQVIPVGYAACALLAEKQGRWLPATRIVLPPPALMRRALDKRETNLLAVQIGVPAPRSVQPGSIDEVGACATLIGYPLVIKSPLEGVSDVVYVDGPSSLLGTYEKWLARHAGDAELPLLQQRIVGDGFGVFATYQNGRCRRIAAHRRIREYPVDGGPSSCAEVFDDPVLLELGRRMLDALDWHGVAMVEFKRHTDGRYYLMEINPKFWGSLDLALAAGCDFPGDLLAIGRGEDLPEVSAPAAGLRLCWPLSADLKYLVHRPGRWRAVLHDWLSPSVRTNVRISDPLPNLLELAQTIRSFLPRR